MDERQYQNSSEERTAVYLELKDKAKALHKMDREIDPKLEIAKEIHTDLQLVMEYIELLSSLKWVKWSIFHTVTNIYLKFV